MKVRIAAKRRRWPRNAQIARHGFPRGKRDWYFFPTAYALRGWVPVPGKLQFEQRHESLGGNPNWRPWIDIPVERWGDTIAMWMPKWMHPGGYDRKISVKDLAEGRL